MNTCWYGFEYDTNQTEIDAFTNAIHVTAEIEYNLYKVVMDRTRMHSSSDRIGSKCFS